MPQSNLTSFELKDKNATKTPPQLWIHIQESYKREMLKIWTSSSSFSNMEGYFDYYGIVKITNEVANKDFINQAISSCHSVNKVLDYRPCYGINLLGK